MTYPEPTAWEREIAHAICSARPDGRCLCTTLSYSLARHRAEVVAAEREACARVADLDAESTQHLRRFHRPGSTDDDAADVAHRIAASIRARGGKP